MKYKAVIFDLDDTLFDRTAAQIRVAKLITQRFSQIFSGQSRNRVVEAFIESERLLTVEFETGAPIDDLRLKRSKIFLRFLGIKEGYADAITDMYVNEYPVVNMPITGAVPLVKKVSKRLPVAVVSNGLPDAQYKKIRAIGLDGIFSCIIISEEVGIRKPNLRIFQHAADLLEVEVSECLYVGDSYANDVVGAKSAVMQSCWFKRDLKDEGIVEVKPDFVITDLGQLINVLDL